MNTEEQRMLQYFLFTDPAKLPFNPLPNPEWIDELGHTLKRLIKEKKIKKLYYDHHGIINVI